MSDLSDNDSDYDSDYLADINNQLEYPEAVHDERHRRRIDKIKKTFARNPTDFELLALSLIPLPPHHTRYLRNQEGVNIKCCKKSLRIILSCQISDDVNGLHEAGSLLQVVDENPAAVKDSSTMSAAPATLHHSSSVYINAPTDTAGNGMYHLAAASNRRHSVGNNAGQPASPQCPSSTTIPVISTPRTPSTNRLMPTYTPGSGFSNQRTPSPAKRAFSSTYPSSKPMATADWDSTPPSKRRGGLLGSADRNIASLQQQPTAYTSSQPATSPGVQGQNNGNGPWNPAGSDFPHKLTKFYRHLANPPPQSYISPYGPVKTPEKRNQGQDQYVSGPTSTPLASTPTSLTSLADMESTPTTRYQGSSQQPIGLEAQGLYGWSNDSARQHPQGQHQLRMPQSEALRQRHTDGGLGSTHAYSMTAQGFPVPDRSAGSINSNLHGPLRQPVQENVHPYTSQTVSVPQSQYAVQSNVELGRRLAEAHAQNACFLPAMPAPTAESNDLAPAYSMQESQRNAPWYQQSQNPSSDSRLEIGRGPASHPFSMEPNTWASSTPHPSHEHYARDSHHQDHMPDPNHRPIKPGYLPDVPEYGYSGTSGDNLYVHPATIPPSYRTEATASTGPLSNISQPYSTGLPDPDISLIMQGWPANPYNPYHVQPAPTSVDTPSKKSRSTKKKTPAPKTKKSPTPRKSRAKPKATPQSSETAMGPRPTTPRPVTPRPPMYDFSSPAGKKISATTLANMEAGNYAEFFASAEEEAKWKQDSVAEAIAEQGAPSKYRLKKDEQERKRAEKADKAGKAKK